MATTDLERQTTSKVYEADVPSRDWGWSGNAPNAARIAGVLFAVLLLLMNIGNHIGHIEDIYLTAIAIAILLTIALTARKAPARASQPPAASSSTPSRPASCAAPRQAASAAATDPPTTAAGSPRTRRTPSRSPSATVGAHR